MFRRKKDYYEYWALPVDNPFNSIKPYYIRGSLDNGMLHGGAIANLGSQGWRFVGEFEGHYLMERKRRS